MAISRRTQDLLSKQDFDAVEDDWLGRLAEDPQDLDYFVGVARALVGHGADGRAGFLLGMLDEELAEGGLWRQRLALLRRAGALLEPEPEKLHGRILAALEALHGGHSRFGGLVEAVGLRRAPGDIPKSWEKADRLEALTAFDVGTVVRMEGRGAGRVAEVNLELECFKVDFPDHPGLTIGLRAAPKVLEPLPPHHVLRRKLTEPEALAALAENDPPALLRAVLESYGRPLTGAEVRRAVAGVVPEARWTAWWAAARKHPQVVTGGGGRQTYAWAESDEHALDSLWQGFERAEPRKKLDILRREGERDPDLFARMVAAVTDLGEAAARSDPGLAYEVHAALERAGRAPEGVAWTPAGLLAGAQVRQTLAGIADRQLRDLAYARLREVRDDWPDLYLEALAREEDPRTLSLLADALAGERRADLERFIDATISQPHRAPAAFVWLAERAAGDEALRRRNPLRLLQQILAPPRPELATYRARLVAQADHGGAVPRLLAHLTADQAPQAEEAIHRASALEPFQRQDLTTALHLRFPEQRQEEEAPLYALPASIAAKRAQLRELLEVEIPANRKAIQEARAHGDLSENFEYKSARQRHEYLTARAHQLKAQLDRARPLDPAKVDPSEVRIGTRVELQDSTGATRTLTILGPWESDPDQGVISFESDLAKGLLGRREGEAVELPDGAATITAIRPAG